MDNGHKVTKLPIFVVFLGTMAILLNHIVLLVEVETGKLKGMFRHRGHLHFVGPTRTLVVKDDVDCHSVLQRRKRIQHKQQATMNKEVIV